MEKITGTFTKCSECGATVDVSIKFNGVDFGGDDIHVCMNCIAKAITLPAKQEDIGTSVYSHPACVFNYCPYPKACQPENICIHANK